MMTYQELFFRKSILDAIPMKIGDKKLSTFAVSDVILLQVAYQVKIDEFNNAMQEVLKKLKKDGFDERFQKKKLYDDLCNKEESTLTNDEIKEKSEFEEISAAFNVEFNELQETYSDAYNKKLKEEIPEMNKLSNNTFNAIIDIMDFNEKTLLSVTFFSEPKETSQEELLSMIGYHLVEKA